jgi:hypothetical protein
MFDDSADDKLELLIRKYALPVGLGVAAILSFLIRAVGAPGVFAWLGLACAIGAIAVSVRMRNAAAQGQAVAQFSTTQVDDEVRRQRLQLALSQDLSVTQGRVESVTPYTAVVVYGKPVNHVLHLLASVFLCGLWLPIWILIAVSGGESKRVLSVDLCGNVTKR